MGQSRNENILENMLGAQNPLGEPQSREEALLMQILEQGGGGGSSTLAGLTDVSVTSPSNEQILKYDGETGKWVNDNIENEIELSKTAGPSSIVSFISETDMAYKSVTVDIEATGGNGTPDNPNPINGYSEVNIVNTQNESIVDLFSIDSDFRGTVAFNQLVNKTKFIEITTENYTFTPNNDGTITITILNTIANETIVSLTANTGSSYVKVPVGHKYAILDQSNLPTGVVYRDQYTGVGVGLNTIREKKTYQNILLAVLLPAGLTPQTFTIKPQIIDLTQMFGSTIADYIYSLEQATAGAGVAFFRSIYSADYYDYDVGTNELVGKIIPNATIAFGQTVYGGVLDVTRGKLTVTRGYVDLGDLLYSYEAPTAGIYGRMITTDLNTLIVKSEGSLTPICEKYHAYSTLSAVINSTDGFWESAVGNISFTSAGYTDANTFKTAMSGTKFVYPLATPFDIDLTPEVISAIVGENNVFADCGETTVGYYNSIGESIKDLVEEGVEFWTDISGTLEAGETEITLTNSAITASSTIEVFNDLDVPYVSKELSTGSITLTFDAQESDMSVKVRVS